MPSMSDASKVRVGGLYQMGRDVVEVLEERPRGAVYVVGSYFEGETAAAHLRELEPPSMAAYLGDAVAEPEALSREEAIDEAIEARDTDGPAGREDAPITSLAPGPQPPGAPGGGTVATVSEPVVRPDARAPITNPSSSGGVPLVNGAGGPTVPSLPPVVSGAPSGSPSAPSAPPRVATAADPAPRPEPQSAPGGSTVATVSEPVVRPDARAPITNPSSSGGVPLVNGAGGPTVPSLPPVVNGAPSGSPAAPSAPPRVATATDPAPRPEPPPRMATATDPAPRPEPPPRVATLSPPEPRPDDAVPVGPARHRGGAPGRR